MSDIAIKADGLSKRYRIGALQRRHDTLRDQLTDAFCRFRHRLYAVGRRGLGTVSNVDDHIWALRDVSFDVGQGEVVGIIGRNGAGKTTLLKVLARITEPTEGRAEIRGRVGCLLEVGTGFHPELTGRENIYLSGAILGMGKAEIRRKFDQIVSFAELERFMDTPVKRYSSGMYVRLAFAVAAHLEPEILLVDEVLAVGDASFQKKCLGKMGDVAREGRTVLFVSHNMAAVQHLCETAHLLDKGRIAASGEVNAVIAGYLDSVQDVRITRLSERADRRGNGELRFTNVWLENSKGDLSPCISSGQDIRIVCSFQNRGLSSLSGTIFSVGVVSVLGEQLLLFRNDYSGDVFDQIPSQGEVVCKVPRFPLMPGSYRIDLYAESPTGVLDWVSSAAEFQVVEGDFFGSGKLKHTGFGPFLADHTWEMRDGASEH